MKKVVVADYTEILAKEFGLPENKIKNALNLGFRNMSKMIERKEAVWIKGFGEFRAVPLPKDKTLTKGLEGPMVDTTEMDIESVLKLLENQ